MKVKELIALLQGCDPEQDVIVNGYEGGFQDIHGVDSFEVVCNVNTEWYYGPHEKVDGWYEVQWPDHARKHVTRVG